jgi:hypothetical protein
LLNLLLSLGGQLSARTRRPADNRNRHGLLTIALVGLHGTDNC